MPKPYKIKRYGKKKQRYRAKPHPLTVIFLVLLTGALVFVGVSIYQPIYDYIVGGVARERNQTPVSDEGEVSQVQTPEPEPEPAPEPPQAVSGLQAVYVPPQTVADSAAFEAFLQTLDGTGINAVMIDLKDQNGTVLYSTMNQNAHAWGAVAETAFDLTALAERLEGAGLHLIARLSAFRDEPAARGERGNAIHYQATEALWLDNYADAGGRPWLNPYAAGARGYIADLCLEAAQSGAAMIVLQDVQFPDASITPNANFGAQAEGISRAQILGEFAQELGSALAEQGVRLSVYCSGVTFTQAYANEYRFGGEPESVVGETLVLGCLPQSFYDGFDEDGLTLAQPFADPAATAAAVIEYVQGRVAAETGIVPLLTGGNEAAAGTDYTAGQIQAQIDAARGLGLQEYILYCTSTEAYLLK